MVSTKRGMGGERGGPGQEMQGSGRVRGGGQGGSTKLSGTFKGDMHEVPGYPLHEERGRLGFGPRSGHDAPRGPTSHPRGGVRVGKGTTRGRGRRGKVRGEGWEVMPGQ